MKPIGFYNYTVIATYLGLAAAFLGCYFATEDEIKSALICLIIAGGFDMIDGKIASTRKRTRQEKNFGIQIDSLCDLVSFGVLPALVLGCFGLPKAVQIPLGIAFTLAAIIRLSYFNVTEIDRQAMTQGSRKAYEGLPVTSVALILPFFYLFSALCGDAFGWVYAGLLLLCSVLFLTPFKLKKAGMGQIIAMGIVGAVTLVGMILI